jgi:predicted ATPase with chaperone activity
LPHERDIINNLVRRGLDCQQVIINRQERISSTVNMCAKDNGVKELKKESKSAGAEAKRRAKAAKVRSKTAKLRLQVNKYERKIVKLQRKIADLERKALVLSGHARK